MQINELIIVKISEDNFQFKYDKTEDDLDGDMDVDEQRKKIVRFMDDAVDVLLRLTNRQRLSQTKNMNVIEASA